MDHRATPLVTALAAAAQRPSVSFHTPGHKGGAGTPAELVALLGTAALGADLPELPGLDNLFAPDGPILAAQTLAAHAFGADYSFFLANGSTCGLEAALLATCGPGDRVVVPRNVHRSVLAGLVLCGAAPVYVEPVIHQAWDLAWGMSVAAMATTLAQVADIRAVVMVSPNYQGICGDVQGMAAIAHRYGIPLIVDAAHGAHLGFHPDLPPAALTQGADIVVQSTHKTLAALTQGAMLHGQGQRVDRDRLQRALALTQSTSPNYLVLASLDGARAQMACEGRALLERTLALVQGVRSQLQRSSPLTVLTLPPQTPGFTLDPSRLVVDVSALGLTGFAADEYLHTHQGITVELPTLRQVTGIFTHGTTAGDGARLQEGLRQLVQHSAPGGTPDPSMPEAGISGVLYREGVGVEQRGTGGLVDDPWRQQGNGRRPYAVPPLTPREAFFAPHYTLPLAAAAGQISVDSLCPYPPGIPVVLPGERISEQAIAHLQSIHHAGGTLTGFQGDHTLGVRVVRS